MGASAVQKPPATAIYGYSTSQQPGTSKVTGYQPSAAEINRTSLGLAPGSNAAYKYPLEGSFTTVDEKGNTGSISAQQYAAEQSARLKEAGSPKGIAAGPGLFQNLLGAQTGSNLFPGQPQSSYIQTPGNTAAPASAPAAGNTASASASPSTPKTPQAPASPAVVQTTQTSSPARAQDPATTAQALRTFGKVQDPAEKRTKRARGNLFGKTLITGGLGLTSAPLVSGKKLFGQ